MDMDLDFAKIAIGVAILIGGFLLALAVLLNKGKKRAERLRSGLQWQWHLDEMFVKINGEPRYLWRAVDHEGEVLEILEASPDRIEPECPHFGQCGGCSLQHLAPERQIEYKDRTLRQNLARIGKVEPEAWWAPLTGPLWGYRRKARLSVRYVHKKGRVLVGFRERYGRFVADLGECHVLDPRVAAQLVPLAELVHGMDARSTIPQIEVACGDERAALVVRHLEPLSADDLGRLRQFEADSGLAILLQPGGPATIHALTPPTPEHRLSRPARTKLLQSLARAIR